MIKLNKKGHLVFSSKRDTKILLCLVGRSAEKYEANDYRALMGTYREKEIDCIKKIRSIQKLMYD